MIQYWTTGEIEPTYTYTIPNTTDTAEIVDQRFINNDLALGMRPSQELRAAPVIPDDPPAHTVKRRLPPE